MLKASYTVDTVTWFTLLTWFIMLTGLKLFHASYTVMSGKVRMLLEWVDELLSKIVDGLDGAEWILLTLL